MIAPLTGPAPLGLNAGALAATIAVNHQLYADCPALCRTFATSEGGLVQLRGDGALAAGPADSEELAGFLAFAGVRALRSDGAVPEGWRAGEPVCQLALTGSLPALPAPQGVRLTEEPSPRLAALLQPGLTGKEQDNFYADLCTRRNHGQGALVTAVEEGGGPLGCAALLLEPGSRTGVLTAVAVAPAARDRGLGRWLVAELCRPYGGWRLLLECAPALTSFYGPLGFTQPNDIPAPRWWVPADRENCKI